MELADCLNTGLADHLAQWDGLCTGVEAAARAIQVCCHATSQDSLVTAANEMFLACLVTACFHLF